MFHPLLDAADPTFRILASDRNVPTVEPLRVSAWAAMSAMQKGIRRSNVDLALRAAATLLKDDPTKLWRRLTGIAFEDVGLASVGTIRLVIAATAGKNFRQQFGGEWRVASMLVEHMAAAPKCRAADDPEIPGSLLHIEPWVLPLLGLLGDDALFCAMVIEAGLPELHGGSSFAILASGERGQNADETSAPT